MATSKRPSFLKRQKEQTRQARAEAKRQAKLERKRGGESDIGSLEELGVTGTASAGVDLDANEEAPRRV